MELAAKQKIVRVSIEERSPAGLFVATSPDMKGLLGAEYSIEELEESIPNIIRDLHAVAGVNVIVTRGDQSEDGLANYVVVTSRN